MTTPFPLGRLELGGVGLKRLLGLALALVLVLGAIASAQAKDEVLPDPVEAGRTALRTEANFPWYDADADAIRRVEVSPTQPPRRRQDWRWESQPRSTKPFNWQMPFGEVFARILQYAAWTLLALLFGYGIYLAVRAALRQEVRLTVEGVDEDRLSRVTDVERIENLPFHLQKAKRDLLAEAERLYRQGKYSEAMVYLFSYQLVQLDRHHWIRLTKGKTNRQYLREMRGARPLRQLMGRSMVAFEEVFFGHHQLDQSQFEELWNRLGEFHRSVVPEGATRS